MITKNGVNYPTIKDAALEFGVQPNTIYMWIRNGVIDEPPKIDRGLRSVNVFPQEYMNKALSKVEEHRRQRSISKE